MNDLPAAQVVRLDLSLHLSTRSPVHSASPGEAMLVLLSVQSSKQGVQKVAGMIVFGTALGHRASTRA